LTELANKKKSLPAPNQYIKCRNWEQEARRDKRDFQKFLKSEKLTETAAILKRK
jgi:hypothetical protein